MSLVFACVFSSKLSRKFSLSSLVLASVWLCASIISHASAASLTLSKDQVLGFSTVVGSNGAITESAGATLTTLSFFADTLEQSDAIWCSSSLCSIHNYSYARFGLSGFGDLSAFDEFRLNAQGSTEPYGGITYNTRLVAGDAHGTIVVGDDINSLGSAPLSLLGLDRTQITFLGFDILTIQFQAYATVLVPNTGTYSGAAVLADPLGGTPPDKNLSAETVASAPVPAAGLLLMSGLASLGFVGRRARRKAI